MRIPPYTYFAIRLQSGKFNDRNRMFNEFQDLVDLITGDRPSSDNLELIPELFCMPEVFINK